MNTYLQPKIWENELNAGNLESVLKCYASDAVLFATFEPAPILTPEGIRAYFTGFLSRDGAGVKFDESSMMYHSISDNAYLCTGLYEFFYRENEELVRHPARFSYMVEVDSIHQIKHHHSSVIPA